MRQHEQEQARDDLRVGVLASLLANIHRDPKKHRKAFGPHDFFSTIPRPTPPKQTAAEIEAAVAAFVKRGRSKR